MWTLQDAKNRFSAVVEAALAGTPQEVTRRGRPAVVVLSAEEYQRLLAGAVRSRESFAAHLMAFPGDETAPEIDRAKVQPRDVAF
jgi:prevent-host-death family protein